jgi:CheY-like chemotaxis protein
MARILFVDCCQERCNAVMALLHEQGHDVHIVNCAERAMLRVHEGQGYDVIVIHLFLPGMDGAELSRWLARGEAPCCATKIAFTCKGERVPLDATGTLPAWLPVDRFYGEVDSMEDLAAGIANLLAHSGPPSR